MIHEYKLDELNISVSDTREEMGEVGAEKLALLIRAVVAEKGEANMIFASAPSQMDVLNRLLEYDDIPWGSINAFHMDEYVGVAGDAPYSFAQYIRERLFEKKGFKSVNYINGMADDLEAECQRYSRLLEEHPVDITVYGIGANGHLAFNDPGIASFTEKALVKLNKGLDDTCVGQQVDDGWFKNRDAVPKMAFTVTMPALTKAKHMVGMCPGELKADIIAKLFTSPISTDLPASVLRRHPDAYLYLDAEAVSRADKAILAGLEVKA